MFLCILTMMIIVIIVIRITVLPHIFKLSFKENFRLSPLTCFQSLTVFVSWVLDPPLSLLLLRRTPCPGRPCLLSPSSLLLLPVSQTCSPSPCGFCPPLQWLQQQPLVCSPLR